MGKLSKFEYGSFYGGQDDLAVSKQRYSKEEALEIARQDYYSFREEGYIAVKDGYVRHRAGITEDNEPFVGWWLEYEEHKRSCQCWVFHYTKDKDKDISKIGNEYEYIQINEIKNENVIK